MKKQAEILPLELTISHLAGLGDGVAVYRDKPVFIAKTAPGDRVLAAIRIAGGDQYEGQLLEILETSPQRVNPPCPHFSSCGGCSLQHLEETSYLNFKQQIMLRVMHQLRQDNALLQPIVEVGSASRRRIELKIAAGKEGVALGFLAAKSHARVNVSVCPVSEPALATLIVPLKEVLRSLSKPGQLLSISLTKLAQGAEAVLQSKVPLSAADKQSLTEFSAKHNLVRFCVMSGESLYTVYDAGEAYMELAGIQVAVPPGAFLQATEKGQQALTERVVAHLADCNAVVDLYAGFGAYSFPLRANVQRISAYEGNPDTVAAMHNAILRHGLDDRVSANGRDLYAQPVTVQELNNFDGVVINPPRNGALPQMRQIGNSRIRKVAMVSCNPATFVRDAKCLLETGYKLTSLTPIDQFYWTAHLELVACFERPQ